MQADRDEQTEAEIDTLIAEFDGDARAVIRALLHDLEVLATDYADSVSHGFVRGDVPRRSRRPE